jgi:hypothetical protein
MSPFSYGTHSVGPSGQSYSKPDQTENSSVHWTQLNRFYLKTETEWSLKNLVFLKKDRTAGA